MSPDDLTDRDLLELLEQARHDLQMCKKSLAFKESLLTDLEIENAELSEVNEKLDRELKILKRRESRRFESTGSTEDCVDDGYGHWSNDEDEVPTFLPTKISESKGKLDACSNCRDHAVEREELFERIEELHEQVEVVQKVNKLLQEDVSQKAAQISDLRQALLDKQVREERLEADLEFTAAEREIALRDLHDFHSITLSSRRSSEEYLRSSSIGSSIGDELGMPKRRICEDITLPIQSFMEWEKFLAEPEAGAFSELESVSMESSRESFLGEHLHSSDSEQATFSETADSALDDSSGTRTVASETDRRSENPNPPTHKSIEDWNGTRYLSHQYFGWRSLVCCGPTPETPKRERTVVASNSREERAGFLSLFKRRFVKNN